jgi:hypothetical protein
VEVDLERCVAEVEDCLVASGGDDLAVADGDGGYALRDGGVEAFAGEDVAVVIDDVEVGCSAGRARRSGEKSRTQRARRKNAKGAEERCGSTERVYPVAARAQVSSSRSRMRRRARSRPVGS